MDLPDKNVNYKLKEYWDKRYTKEDNFEWCKGYDDFKQFIHEHARKCDRILMLGCGNSTLSEEMYKDGYRNIVNIDFSPVVIENMKRKCKDLVEMEWMVMDIMSMTFSTSSFDVVIEKATLDALMVGEKDLWNPSEETRRNMDCVLLKVFNVFIKHLDLHSCRMVYFCTGIVDYIVYFKKGRVRSSVLNNYYLHTVVTQFCVTSVKIGGGGGGCPPCARYK